VVDYVLYAIDINSNPKAVIIHAWLGGRHILEVKQKYRLGHGIPDLTTAQAVAVGQKTAKRVLKELWRRRHG
jgi:hypothetical protein